MDEGACGFDVGFELTDDVVELFGDVGFFFCTLCGLGVESEDLFDTGKAVVGDG